MVLPAGLVTFVFTDVEGSTRLLRELGHRYQGLLEAHFAILREAFESAGGAVIRTEGDMLFVAFASAADAVGACVQAQRDLIAYPWPTDGELRVRMGLHTGDAIPIRGDYSALAVNQAARVSDAAHGGQILLSAETGALVEADGGLPPLAELRLLGVFWLKGFPNPEPLVQLIHPDLPSRFPSPRTPAVTSNNLPIRRTSFVGREHDRTALEKLVSDNWLVTVTGPGGVGKTRLATEVASSMVGDFGDGVWLVELGPVLSGALVPGAFAAVFGVKEDPGSPLVGTLVDWLSTRSVLIVIDNCEHLVDPIASVVDQIGRRCPGVKILATSRDRLRIDGEVAWPLPPLAVGEPDQSQDSSISAASDAVRLFIERAQLVAPDFVPTPDLLPVIVSICHRADGLPLAIELVASAMDRVPPDLLEEVITVSLLGEGQGSRSGLPHQRTLDALIRWSFERLPLDAQRLLADLSVFVGGFSREAAIEFAGGATLEVTAALDRLIDSSLVVVEDLGPSSRCRLLGLIRDFAALELRRRRGAADARSRHAEWALRAATGAGAGQAEEARLDWIGLEYENLRAALEWSLSGTTSDRERASLMSLQLCSAASSYWTVRGPWSEGRAWFERALEATAESGRPAAPYRMNAFLNLGVTAYQQGDLDGAGQAYTNGLEVARQYGDADYEGRLMCNLANVLAEGGSLAAATELQTAALSVLSSRGDPLLLARPLANLGAMLLETGDLDNASRRFSEAIELLEAAGDVRTAGAILLNVASVAERRGDRTGALHAYQRSLEIARQLGDRRIEGIGLHNLGTFHQSEGQIELARQLLGESLALRSEIGDQMGIAVSKYALADIEADHGDPGLAVGDIEEVVELFTQLALSTWEAKARVLLGHALRLAGRSEQAQAVLQAVVPMLDGRDELSEVAAQAHAELELLHARNASPATL